MTFRTFCFSFILFFLFTGCAPKVTSSILKKKEPLKEGDIVVLIALNEPFTNEGELIGTTKVGDNGLSSKCSFHEVEKILIAQARSNGANIIKIKRHRVPDAVSSCHRIEAELYLVSEPRKFEKMITWSKYRKLAWEDYKGSAESTFGENVAAVTFCGFGFEAKKTAYSKTKIFAQNTFDCYKSWVRPEQKYRDDLLEHEQKHFDLCEVYARQLRKELSGPNLTLYGFSDQTAEIYMEILQAYNTRQKLYDDETSHGLNKGSQEKWNKMISDELTASEEYQ